MLNIKWTFLHFSDIIQPINVYTINGIAPAGIYY